MTRRRLSTRERVALFEAASGLCHICAGKIGAGERWEVEHVVPLALGGEDGGDNLRPAHVRCHRGKSAADAKATARAKRLCAAHIGARAPKSRGFRAWRNFKGEITRRDE
jgi:5-methylcytosine-specific restriction endonuclease McrA